MRKSRGKREDKGKKQYHVVKTVYVKTSKSDSFIEINTVNNFTIKHILFYNSVMNIYACVNSV